MEKGVLALLFLFVFSFPGCGDNSKSASGDAVLESFVLQAGGKSFQAVIDQEQHTVSVGGIEALSDISGVLWKLSEGAVISPDPTSVVGNWKQNQQFKVTSEHGNSTLYTVFLKDLKEKESGKVVIGYIPGSDWEYDTEFKNMRWEHLTHINISFLYVTADGELLDSEVSAHLAEIRSEAKKHGVKVLISLQSDGQRGFAVAIKSEAVREKLAAAAVKFVRDHQLDGVDIDFEIYDAVGPDLLAFVKELHRQKDADMLQTCAVATWNAGQGYSTEWHQYFDYINLMAYDFTGGWAQEGQHSSYEQSVGLVNLWLTTLQAPASKLVLGLPFYGYSWDDLPGLDASRAIRYHQILTQYAGQDVPDKDVVGRTYYNGKPTLRKKCRYVKEHNLGGVMIWQLFQDAKDDQNSLLEVIGEEINSK